MLRAFGIGQSEVNPDADILTMRPDLSTMSLMQLTYGNNGGGNGPGGGPGGNNQWPCPPDSCIARPPIQEISQLPSGTSALNTVITEHAITTLHLQKSIRTPLAATVLGWLLAGRDPAGIAPAAARITPSTIVVSAACWVNPSEPAMLRCVGKINRRYRIARFTVLVRVTRENALLTEDGVEKAVADRIEQQLRSAFPQGAIVRVQALQYGDDPEVEPGRTAMRVFFDWPGRSEGKKADPKTVHAFCTANSAAFDMLRAKLPSVIGWVEFRPEPPAGAASPDGLSYRITDQGRRAATPDDVLEDSTPVMTRLGPVDLATVDTLIAAGIVNSRAEGLRWALGRIREHPAYAQLQQLMHEVDELKTRF